MGELEAAFRDAQTQWMIMLCIVYAAVFWALRNGLAATARRVFANSMDIWRVGFLLFSAAHYFLSYGKASHSRQAVTLLGCALLGSGVWVGVFWGGEPRRNERALRRLLIVLVVLLGMGCFWGSGAGARFAYKDHERWHGPWDNPNLCGLLMASGVALVTGLGVQGVRRGESHFSSAAFPRTWRRLGGSLVPMASTLAAGAAMAIGVLRSYSRGAWVGTFCGAGYLAWHACGPRRRGIENRGFHILKAWQFWRLRSTWLLVALVLLSIVLLTFWNVRHAEAIVARRVMSVGNVNDFSWRNRVAAWEGAMQMIAEKPWFGFGWNRPEPVYDHFYRESKVSEAAAIQMNDYLTLGATLGVPALGCFGMYLYLALWRRVSCAGRGVPTAETAGANSPISEADWLKAVCRAGAIVLLVGFWFDGGLFRLATAGTFWVLIELGRED
jgi:O-antigen ligase